MNRQEKRETQRKLSSLANKAKQDMLKWAMELEHDPTEEEGKAWKAGYIAGINRNSQSK